MIFDVLTIFPGFFTSPLDQSLLAKARDKGLLDFRIHNIRDHATDKHRTTDDYPYGGGHGMVMKVEPVARALDDLRSEGPKPVVALTTPQGRPFDQELAKELSKVERLAIVCGRYEGVDERVRSLVDMELSVGDFVLTGGEAASLAIIDSVARLVPGVLGEPESAAEESFSDGLLEYPQYTRPEVFKNMRVPEVLLSGNHAEIKKWRRRQSLERTLRRRPDLLEKARLSEEDKKTLEGLRPGTAVKD